MVWIGGSLRGIRSGELQMLHMAVKDMLSSVMHKKAAYDCIQLICIARMIALVRARNDRGL